MARAERLANILQFHDLHCVSDLDCFGVGHGGLFMNHQVESVVIEVMANMDDDCFVRLVTEKEFQTKPIKCMSFQFLDVSYLLDGYGEGNDEDNDSDKDDNENNIESDDNSNMDYDERNDE